MNSFLKIADQKFLPKIIRLRYCIGILTLSSISGLFFGFYSDHFSKDYRVRMRGFVRLQTPFADATEIESLNTMLGNAFYDSSTAEGIASKILDEIKRNSEIESTLLERSLKTFANLQHTYERSSLFDLSKLGLSTYFRNETSEYLKSKRSEPSNSFQFLIRIQSKDLIVFQIQGLQPKVANIFLQSVFSDIPEALDKFKILENSRIKSETIALLKTHNLFVDNFSEMAKNKPMDNKNSQLEIAVSRVAEEILVSELKPSFNRQKTLSLMPNFSNHIASVPVIEITEQIDLDSPLKVGIYSGVFTFICILLAILLKDILRAQRDA